MVPTCCCSCFEIIPLPSPTAITGGGGQPLPTRMTSSTHAKTQHRLTKVLPKFHGSWWGQTLGQRMGHQYPTISINTHTHTHAHNFHFLTWCCFHVPLPESCFLVFNISPIVFSYDCHATGHKTLNPTVLSFNVFRILGGSNQMVRLRSRCR